MQTRSLGRTDLRLSEIALGTWGLASWSYGKVLPSHFEETVRSAIEKGVTTFDLAPLWGDGEGERKVAEWTRDIDAAPRSKRFVVHPSAMSGHVSIAR